MLLCIFEGKFEPRQTAQMAGTGDQNELLGLRWGLNQMNHNVFCKVNERRKELPKDFAIMPT